MTSKTFTSGTVLDSPWLNDVNGATYNGSSVFTPSGTGAVARTTQTKLREQVSVLDFGADPTGVADSLAAFQAAHNSLSTTGNAAGGTIYIPKGTYYLSDTWKITKRVTIQGTNSGDQTGTAGSLLNFAAGKTGIRFYSYIDSPDGGAGDFSELRNVSLYALSKTTDAKGVHATCVIGMFGVSVRSFKGHGIYFNGQTGTGATGICDSWRIDRCRSVSNDGDGFRVEGNDSQVGCATVLDCSQNGGWGVYNAPAYTNTFISCHCAGNVSGDYKDITAATGYGGVFIGCYEEFGGTASSWNSNSLILGGTLSANATGNYVGVINGLGMGVNVPTGSRHYFTRNLLEIGRIETNNKLDNFAGYRCTVGAGTFVDNDGDRISISGNTTASQNRIIFNNPNGTVGSITTSGTTTSYNTSSDYRLKANQNPLKNSGAFIDSLIPKSWTWSDGSKGAGFIAHEVQQVSPTSVMGEKDAMEEFGDLLNEKGEVYSKDVAHPSVLTTGWSFVVKGTRPKYQSMEYGSAEFIANIVAELQDLRKRVALLESK